MKDLISPAEAMERIRAQLPEIPAIQCPLNKCAGRILRQSVTADRPFPPFDRAMMDGYALRAADIAAPGPFNIVAEAPAGSPQQVLPPHPKACIEIMTGAMLPQQADCVVPYETTRRLDGPQMELLEPAAHAAGDCIHPLGSDRPAGTELLAAGSVVGSREIAVIASCGLAQVAVSQIPSIAIVSTGDELVEVSQTPQAHQIRRSNDIAIETALARHQLHAQDHAHLPDSPDASRARLEALIHNNRIVILSGGVSMGKKDFIPAALEKIGLNCHFHGVAQKPGKPFGCWSRPGCIVFTLPGNPLSTLACLHHYVLPAIFCAMGQSQPPAPRRVTLAQPAKLRDDLTTFLPVQLSPDGQAEPRPVQNSGDLVRILDSDGYLELPPSDARHTTDGQYFNFHPWH